VAASFSKASNERLVFLDIGAGIGYYSILIKKRYPQSRVIAVEALPRHAAAIREHLPLNQLADDTIEIREIAVASSRAAYTSRIMRR
jgi:FkbM family methyltransferase